MPRREEAGADKSPFGGANAPRGAANIHWVKPELVAEIEFANWTDDGLVRQAAFKGLRADKPAAEVEASTSAAPSTPVVTPPEESGAKKTVSFGRVTIMGTTITHPDKPLWPDGGDGKPATKLDLAEYLAAMAEWIMPHIAGRPCSIIRARTASPAKFSSSAMPGRARQNR